MNDFSLETTWLCRRISETGRLGEMPSLLPGRGGGLVFVGLT